MRSALITGANGFIGQALCRNLAARKYAVRAAVRHPGDAVLQPGCQTARIEGLEESDWRPALEGMDCVVHLAARVHVMQDNAALALEKFRKVNVNGTLKLARQAAVAGARRFVFVSSIKVNGEYTSPGKPFTANDPPAPVDAYAVSKREAEDGLRRLTAETGMEVVIIRPPLVYGPGVKANFLSMMRYVKSGLPLPFGAVNNRRSLVALDNLVDLIVSCMEHPAAANKIFMVSDGEDLSTPELLRRMGRMLGKPARLLPVPPSFLKVGAALFGRQAELRRLCGSLQVDIAETRAGLDWSPPVSVDDALNATARHFLDHSR